MTETGGRAARPLPTAPLVQWIHRRRPLLTFAVCVVVVLLGLWDPAPPARLLDPGTGPVFWLAWGLVILGVAVRVWGSGNLRKNQEITRTGIYRMVRHPLYLGSLAVFLAFFITLGNPWIGAAFWAGMVAFVYYPTMMDEEAWLVLHYPEQTGEYAGLPRLLPNLLRLPEALRTDRFTLRAAWGNLGMRSLWALVALPIALELMRWVEEKYR
jgi:protein-S-isoprenylcysteine O-methyltransferase Ste14